MDSTRFKNSAKLRYVCYENGTFVAVAAHSEIGAYSTDGINWTTIYLPVHLDWWSVCYGNGTFVAVESDTDTAVYGTMEKENLKTVLDNKADTGHNHDSSYAALSHTHTLSQISDFTEALQDNETYKFLLDLVENLETNFNKSLTEVGDWEAKVDEKIDELDEIYASKTKVEKLTA